MREFTVSNNLLSRPEALRERAADDGYLFFQGMADLDALWDLRRGILTLCAEAGWLAPNTDVMDGIAAPGVAHIEGEPGHMAVYRQVMALEPFHAFAHQPALLAMLDALFDEPTLVHARNIARIIFPQATEHTTPAHQDYIHIQGTPATWTAWMPLGDCPQRLGSLAVLPGSHRQGLCPVQKMLGAGGHGIPLDTLPDEWVASDFAAGDVLFFHSMAVHRGLPNQTPDRIRVSVDYRYQGESQPVVPASLLPHYGNMPWGDIYADWQSDAFQYYWQEKPLNLVEWRPLYDELIAAGGENGSP